MPLSHYLLATPVLDFNHVLIQQLIGQRNWLALDDYDAIGAAYSFVKNEILFGYNRSDDISASDVLKQGYGQCNTKSSLLMALLRGMGIPCRLHGFTIDNRLQAGAVPGWIMPLAPASILHSWVEVFYEERWVNLEGFILDPEYLNAVQKQNVGCSGSFTGFGIATPCLQNPPVEWQGQDTYIQKEGINQDFGVFDTPDDFYSTQGTNLKGLKRLLFVGVIRHLMNFNVNRVRKSKLMSPLPVMVHRQHS